ncbi:DUF6252 family protein [Pontibacter chitinilyticus]|uniref:DUF6252 family protein n=1 Tax=Pontibacter chitinilyticus TaxID=2674989 RepID=UPI00321A51C7
MKQNFFNRFMLLRWLLPAALSLLLLGLQACSKDKMCEDEPFCARVNGKVWVPVSDSDFKTSELTFHLIDDTHQFWVRAKRSSAVILFGVINANSNIQIGDYILNESNNNGYYSPEPGKELLTDSTYTGLLSITAIDRVKKTIAGTFYFRARNPATGEVVDVSHGRFDAIYSEY